MPVSTRPRQAEFNRTSAPSGSLAREPGFCYHNHMDSVSLFLLFLLGASIGSFINAALYRLPRRESVWRGRSHCPACGRVIAWRDLIPLASFVALAGYCRHCRQRISWRYPAVEAAGGVLFVLGGLVLGPAVFSWPGLAHLALYLTAASFFFALFMYDLEHYLIPDRIVLPAIAVVVILNILAAAFGGSAPASAWFLLLGALTGGFWFLWQFLVSRGRWVGGGDIRLGLLMGALLGWPRVLLALMVAYIGGGLLALCLIFLGKKTFKSRLPFATILLPSALIVFLWGDDLWRWYLGLLGF